MGLTVTATALSKPIKETLPVGAILSQLAPATLTVAGSAAPLLEITKALVSDGLGIGAPVTYVKVSAEGVAAIVGGAVETLSVTSTLWLTGVPAMVAARVMVPA